MQSEIDTGGYGKKAISTKGKLAQAKVEEEKESKKNEEGRDNGESHPFGLGH